MLKFIFVLCLLLPSISFSANILVTKNSQPIYEQNADATVPIASITKLMSAMVILDSGLDLSKKYQITHKDVDNIKHSRSRLSVGTYLSGYTLLQLALMSSDNRAISALMRNHPKGYEQGIALMNFKAKEIGMVNAVFYEPTGLNPNNKASVKDLERMVQAASNYKIIRKYTTTKSKVVRVGNRNLLFLNSNRLVRRGDWNNVLVSKTGFINEAGMCVVMNLHNHGNSFSVIVMDAYSNNNRFALIDNLRKKGIFN